MKKLSIIFLTILFSVKIIPQIVESGLESIKSDELLRTVKILASAEFDGRLPGSEGYTKAANFAAEKFAQLSLIPAGDEGFFQHLDVEYNKIDTPAVFNLIMNNLPNCCFVLASRGGQGVKESSLKSYQDIYEASLPL